jgi:hypothetical protein
VHIPLHQMLGNLEICNYCNHYFLPIVFLLYYFVKLSLTNMSMISQKYSNGIMIPRNKAGCQALVDANLSTIKTTGHTIMVSR